jgi:hypothetical protein
MQFLHGRPPKLIPRTDPFPSIFCLLPPRPGEGPWNKFTLHQRPRLPLHKGGRHRRKVSTVRARIAKRGVDELGLSMAEIARHAGVTTLPRRFHDWKKRDDGDRDQKETQDTRSPHFYVPFE